MKDLLAWFGFKGFPFDKNLKTQDVFQTEPFKEAMARFDYIKRRAHLASDRRPRGGQNPRPEALRRYPDENLFKPYYTPFPL